MTTPTPSKLRGVFDWEQAFFHAAFVRGFLKHVPLVAAATAVVGMLLGAGGSLGLPVLYWHSDWSVQLEAGLSVALTFGVVFFCGHLLDEEELETAERTAPWPFAAFAPSPGARYAVGVVLSSAVVAVVAMLCWLLLTVVLWLRETPQAVSPRGDGGPWSEAAGQGVYLAVGLGFGLLIIALLRAGMKRLEGLASTSIAGLRNLLAVPDGSATPRSTGPHGKRQRAMHGVLWLVDPRKRIRKRLHGKSDSALVSAVSRHASAVVLCLALLFVESLGFCGVPLPAATSLCATFAFSVALYGYLAYQWTPVAAVAMALMAIFFGGIPVYTHRLPALERAPNAYTSPVPLDHAWNPPVRPTLPGGDEAAPPGTRNDATLVLVEASGGGIRAAVWTNAVLSELETQRIVAPHQVKLIAGASGGMVGASFWAASIVGSGGDFDARHGLSVAALHEAVAAESLSAVARRLVFNDVLMALVPWNTGREDRGAFLEKAWLEAWSAARKKPPAEVFGETTLGSLRDGEQKGWRPTLIYSPMLVEDARRLVISNMDLGFLTATHGPRLDVDAGLGASEPSSASGERDVLWSQSALEFRSLFPRHLATLSVFEAARMSASFPYVSPAAVLPTIPRRRVVDAGYYDNFGGAVVTRFLESCLHDRVKKAWLDGFAKVLVIQIRDGVGDASRTSCPTSERPDGTLLGRGAEELTSPLAGLLTARNAVSVFRNDEELEAVARKLGPRFSTIAFEFSETAPLSWALTTQAKANLQGDAKKQVTQASERLSKWLGDPGSPEPRPPWWFAAPEAERGAIPTPQPR